MHPTPIRDDQPPHLRVKWLDLLPMSTIDTIRELALPLPWLVLSLVSAHFQIWIPALGCSFFFFLASLRVVHNAFHHALGLSPAGDHLVMLVLSPLMFCSSHAVQFNHHRHHLFRSGRTTTTGEKKSKTDDIDKIRSGTRADEEDPDGDVEGSIAKKSAVQALVSGPVFPVLINRTAWRLGSRNLRMWLLLEWSLLGLLIYLTTSVFPDSCISLRYHVCVTALGQALGAFFCVWTVHHDCREDNNNRNFNARTSRKPWLNFVSMSMFYHLEHHLFPRVPTSKLHILAERLDQVTPKVCKKPVI